MQVKPLRPPAHVALLAVVVFTTYSDTTSGRECRLNIVLIMDDDMDYSDLGSYGSEVDTPNINRLAQDGPRLTLLSPGYYNSYRWGRWFSVLALRRTITHLERPGEVDSDPDWAMGEGLS